MGHDLGITVKNWDLSFNCIDLTCILGHILVGPAGPDQMQPISVIVSDKKKKSLILIRENRSDQGRYSYQQSKDKKPMMDIGSLAKKWKGDFKMLWFYGIWDQRDQHNKIKLHYSASESYLFELIVGLHIVWMLTWRSLHWIMHLNFYHSYLWYFVASWLIVLIIF